MAKIYRYSNKGIIGRKNEAIKIPISISGDLSTETRHVFWTILNNLPFRTANDSIQGNRLADAIDEAEGKDYIEIGEGVYDWLQERLKEQITDQNTRESFLLCPRLFRVNGEKVSEFIKEGFEKPREPSKEKKGKGKADEATPEG